MLTNDDNISALENFENDMNIITKELNPYLEQVNIFTILGLTNTEIRHSNMLAWLFDSKANHGLGDNFIKNFLEPKLKEEGKGKLNSYDFRVYRELEHIDLLLVSESEKIVVVIENKILTKNHDNQLTKYSQFIEKTYKSKDFSIYQFYLTPDGETPIKESDTIDSSKTEEAQGENKITEIWRPLSYKDIIDNLDKAKSKVKSELKSEAKLLINNYLEILRRDIVKDDNDKLIKKCNEIYAQYKTAIELINKYKTSTLVTVIKSVLFHYKNQKKIKFDNIHNCTTTFKFYTPQMDHILPGFGDKKLSSWGDTHQYDYELIIKQIDNSYKLKINCALAGNNIDEETKKIMHNMMTCSNHKIKEKFTFSVIGTKFKEINELMDEEVMQKKVEELITEMLDWQNELLKKLQK